MAYEFETSKLDGVLIARIGGHRHESLADNFSDLWAFWSSVASEMKREGVHRLLAVISAKGAFRSLEVPAFYRRLGEMGFTASMRAAIVFDIPTHERPVLRLAVNAAESDGWNMRVFPSEAEAWEWLRRD